MLEETRCISFPPPPQVEVVSQTLHWDSTVKRTVWVGGSPEWHLECSGKPFYCPSDPHYRVCTRHPGLPWSRIHRGIPFRTIWDQESKEKKSPGTRESTEVRPAPLSVRRRGLGTGPPPLPLPSRWVETPDFHLLAALGGRCGVDSFCCNVGVLEKGCCMHGSPGIATRVQRGLE